VPLLYVYPSVVFARFEGFVCEGDFCGSAFEEGNGWFGKLTNRRFFSLPELVEGGSRRTIRVFVSPSAVPTTTRNFIGDWASSAHA